MISDNLYLIINIFNNLELNYHKIQSKYRQQQKNSNLNKYHVNKSTDQIVDDWFVLLLSKSSASMMSFLKFWNHYCYVKMDEQTMKLNHQVIKNIFTRIKSQQLLLSVYNTWTVKRKKYDHCLMWHLLTHGHWLDIMCIIDANRRTMSLF